jgi:hypothetical protein
MTNSESISRKIKKEQEKFDRERERIEKILDSKAKGFKKILILLHPKVRKKIKELKNREKELKKYIQENMELIQLEALLESKERYGWELILAEKELEFLENFEDSLRSQNFNTFYKKINDFLKREYGMTSKNNYIIFNELIHLALKYNLPFYDRRKAENMFYYNFIPAAPYYEWGISYDRQRLINILIEKIKIEIENLKRKIEDIDQLIKDSN